MFVAFRLGRKFVKRGDLKGGMADEKESDQGKRYINFESGM